MARNGHAAHRTAGTPSLSIVIIVPFGEPPWNRYQEVYRALIRELDLLGHNVRVLTRKISRPPRGSNGEARSRSAKPGISAYADLADLKARFGSWIRSADTVVAGSGLREGRAICDWVSRVAQGVPIFYDLATTETVTGIRDGTCPYFSAELITRFPLYLSVTGGRMLDLLETEHGSPMARPFYHSVDATQFYPERIKKQWHLGYYGEFEEQRQPALDELLLEPARLWRKGRFAVAGPSEVNRHFRAANVQCLSELTAASRRKFYNGQKFALTAASSEAAESGYSPGRRLLEAAACGVPVITDYWEGLENFFEPLEQILIARCAEETLSYLHELGREERQRIGEAARRRVMEAHTSRQRGLELQRYVFELIKPSVSIPA